MGQLVGFVDAGFLKAEGAKTLGLNGRPNLDAHGVVAVLRSVAEKESCSLLRVYWYDGAFDPASPLYQHQARYFAAIAATPGVQLRLGHVKEFVPGWHAAVRATVTKCGWDIAEFESRFTFRRELQQKGVDTLIVLDLVRLAQRRAYDTAVLLAGDRDLAEAVRVAQDEGRRVLLAHPSSGGVATELRQLADEVRPLAHDELRQMLRIKQP